MNDALGQDRLVPEFYGATGLPQLSDDAAFGQAMTAACAYWIISNGTWMVDRDFEQDFCWGNTTWRQRVFYRLEQFATTTEEFDHLPEMGRVARETVHRLKRHWAYEPLSRPSPGPRGRSDQETVRTVPGSGTRTSG